MLRLIVKGQETFINDEFGVTGGGTLVLEHSLISISKWEAKWKKPFLAKNNKTDEEISDYIRCMSVKPVQDEKIFSALSKANIEDIQKYIADDMTATMVTDNGKPSKEIMTSELIYYYMIANNIPVEFEKWHLNRLLTLIQVCGVKNNPKKMKPREQAKRQRELNAARRRKYNSKG